MRPTLNFTRPRTTPSVVRGKVSASVRTSSIVTTVSRQTLTRRLLRSPRLPGPSDRQKCAHPNEEEAMSTTLIIVIVVVAVVVVAAVAFAAQRGRAKQLEAKRVEAGEHREHAAAVSRKAEQARLQAEEQSDRARKQQAEAEELRRHADEVDPDTDAEAVG